MTLLKAKDRVVEGRSQIRGTVTFVYEAGSDREDDEMTIRWDNGMTGSFKRKFLSVNGVSRVEDSV